MVRGIGNKFIKKGERKKSMEMDEEKGKGEERERWENNKTM